MARIKSINPKDKNIEEKDSTNSIADSAEVPQNKIIIADISEEMKKAYLDYAMSVIVSRALPDVRDGLKPVQRRIIYSMQEQGMLSSGKFYKSATVVGNVMSKYHPHGDSSVYDALVRMAQDFTLRYPLITGQGNFGSLDNDPPAAMRYTEAKLSVISEQTFNDINKDTVNMYLNDLQNMEPEVLPSLLPNMLLNGAQGIAVGMATQIPPHNLREVVQAITALIDKATNIGKNATQEDEQTHFAFEGHTDGQFKVLIAKTEFDSDATVEDLTEFVKGPDYPTGGIIYDKKEIMQVYATGKGRIVTRGVVNIEESKSGRTQIVVTEIPYMVNKSALIEKIADLVKDKKIVGLSDIRDESNREGVRIVIELKRDAVPKKVENSLYKYTQLQNAFNANMVALVHGEPKLLPLKTMLEEFVKHRQEIVIRRTLFLLKKAKAREHILLGYKIALDNLDEVIKLIRSSKDQEAAKQGLITKFGMSEMQAQAVLDLQLRRLAALERQKILDELNEIVKSIKAYETLLASPKKIIQLVRDELAELMEKFGDERRTKVVKGKVGELVEEDLIANERCIVTISQSGYIKRMKEDTYRKQNRGGVGVNAQTLKEEDVIDTLRICQTHDTALFFTSRGRVYKLKVWDIPESMRAAKGTALANFLNISQGERVEAFLALTPEQIENKSYFIVLATKKGNIKKTPMNEFANIRTSGIAAINLTEGDSLVWAKLSTGKDTILMVTSQGQSIRFPEQQVRPMGRAAGGVIGIKYAKKDDYLIGMEIVETGSDKGFYVLTATENGYGKKTILDEYKVQNRGGSGILTYKVTDKTGSVMAARVFSKKEKSDVLIVSGAGKVIRMDSKEIPELGRATIGVRLIKVGSNDKVVSIGLVTEEEKELEIVEPQV
jgi:DNA gyrase subunit A